MLVEPIGHLGAVISYLDLLNSLKMLMWESYGTLHWDTLSQCIYASFERSQHM